MGFLSGLSKVGLVENYGQNLSNLFTNDPSKYLSQIFLFVFIGHKQIRGGVRIRFPCPPSFHMSRHGYRNPNKFVELIGLGLLKSKQIWKVNWRRESYELSLANSLNQLRSYLEKGYALDMKA